MFTLGGIIDGESAHESLQRAGILNLDHVRTGEEVEKNSVPPLTFREKEWIDSRLISGSKGVRDSLGLEPHLLQNYITFYKYYPTYFETLV